ncbi:MAG: adenosine deaminase [Cryomorphaceae bacterium]
MYLILPIAKVSAAQLILSLNALSLAQIICANSNAFSTMGEIRKFDPTHIMPLLNSLRNPSLQLMVRLLAIALTALISISAVAKSTSANDLAALAFDESKGSRPELVNFLEGFPKGADLHNHLDGAVFSEHALHSARQQGLNYDLDSNNFTDRELGGNVIGLDALGQNSDYFRAFREAFSLRAWKQVSGSGRDTFFGVFGRIFSSQIPQSTMLKNVVRQAQIQNIQHLELISPVVPIDVQDKIDAALTEFDITDLETAYAQVSNIVAHDTTHKSVSARIDGWETKGLASESDTSVRYIGYILRMINMRDFFVAAVSNLAAVNADDRIVSLTLVMPEDLPAAAAQFDEQMKVLDFLWKKMGQPNISLHAGELSLEDATLEVLKDRIRKSIDIGHSRRIGHGTSIAWEKDSTGLLQQMASNKTLVELCLSSNEAILDISGRDHPFDLYRKFKVPISLNTDDEGITRSPLTMEFIRAIEDYALSYNDIVELARNSLEYSFLEGQSLFNNGDYASLRPSFNKHDFKKSMLSLDQTQLLADNPKLTAQVKFEQMLANFEGTFRQRSVKHY